MFSSSSARLSVSSVSTSPRWTELTTARKCTGSSGTDRVRRVRPGGSPGSPSGGPDRADASPVHGVELGQPAADVAGVYAGDPGQHGQRLLPAEPGARGQPGGELRVPEPDQRRGLALRVADVAVDVHRLLVVRDRLSAV